MEADFLHQKIVVCGAGGYAGGKFVEYLVRKGHQQDVRAVSSRPLDHWLFRNDAVENVRLDLRNLPACERAVEGAFWVCNFAARVGGIGFIGKNKAECMLSSLINTNLLRAASQVGIAGYFFASSSCVYPSRDSNPVFSESDAYPANPTDGYGWEKLFSERMCQAFSEEKNVPTRVARFHTIYGPGDNRGPERNHVASAMCQRVVEAKLSGVHEINIWGDGTQSRTFLYIDDCTEGVYRMMAQGVPGPVNLSNSEVVSVNDIVTMLEEISAIKLRRFYDIHAPRGAQHKLTNNTALRAALNWEPMTPIKTGLERMYRDFWDSAVLGK